jgi:hypothetical protein
VRSRRRALRCGWQRVVLEQRRPRRGLQRRDGVDAAGQADRPHPPARGLRQHLLRRAQAQPAIHGRQPVALRALRRHPGRPIPPGRLGAPRRSRGAPRGRTTRLFRIARGGRRGRCRTR